MTRPTFTRRETAAVAAALGLGLASRSHAVDKPLAPDLILTNGRFTTLDRANPDPEAVAVTGGRFSAGRPRMRRCYRRSGISGRLGRRSCSTPSS